MFGDPGRMVGRVTLRDDRTLFLFVFAVGAEVSSRLQLMGQRARLRARFGDQVWECRQILDALDRTDDLYFDRVSPDPDVKMVGRSDRACWRCCVLRVLTRWARVGTSDDRCLCVGRRVGEGIWTPCGCLCELRKGLALLYRILSSELPSGLQVLLPRKRGGDYFCVTR